MPHITCPDTSAYEALALQQAADIRKWRIEDAKRHRYRLAFEIAAELTTFERYLWLCPTAADYQNARVVRRYLRRFGERLALSIVLAQGKSILDIAWAA